MPHYFVTVDNDTIQLVGVVSNDGSSTVVFDDSSVLISGDTAVDASSNIIRQDNTTGFGSVIVSGLSVIQLDDFTSKIVAKDIVGSTYTLTNEQDIGSLIIGSTTIEGSFDCSFADSTILAIQSPGFQVGNTNVFRAQNRSTIMFANPRSVKILADKRSAVFVVDPRETAFSVNERSTFFNASRKAS